MNDRKVVLNTVNMNEALRYMGYQNSEPDAHTKELLSVCKDKLLQVVNPQYVYRVFDLDENKQIINSDFKFEGNAIKGHLANCDKAVLLCATLSSDVDKLIRRQQVSGMAEALMIDSMASAVVEQVCESVEEFIRQDLSGYEFTWRFGLGYDDFPLDLQKQFLEVLNAPKRIGVCVSSGMMLTPTKSVTCVIGAGHGLKESNKKSCEFCGFKDKCQFRKSGESCGK